jgi:hypothetical protein
MSFVQADSQDDQKILRALKDNPDLRACFLEMVDITQDTANQLNRGDDAEEAVIQAIRKTGSVLLKEWAQSKADKAAQEAREEPGVRMHEKKRCCGTHP